MMLTLYHRTTAAAARTILRTKRFVSKYVREEVFASTRFVGQAVGYGQAAVKLRIPEHLARLDDEFPSGERHYAVSARDIRPEHVLGVYVPPRRRRP